ncbi:MAG: DUF4416 family protein [Chitinivibrionales bacterium]|nr:DUF4416 family protein [Chitinivibrionales bacterium]
MHVKADLCMRYIPEGACMGQTKRPSPGQLFMAVLYTATADIASVNDALIQAYGRAQFEHGPISFHFSDYYTQEMGTGLLKKYLLFDTYIDRESIAECKLKTNRMEESYRRQGRRTVNLDPGYLTLDKLVLATTKDFFHRIYLGTGIHAEVTLHYRRNKYRYFSWTYPDYREPQFLAFLKKARSTLERSHRREPNGV